MCLKNSEALRLLCGSLLNPKTPLDFLHGKNDSLHSGATPIAGEYNLLNVVRSPPEAELNHH